MRRRAGGRVEVLAHHDLQADCGAGCLGCVTALVLFAMAFLWQAIGEHQTRSLALIVSAWLGLVLLARPIRALVRLGRRTCLRLEPDGITECFPFGRRRWRWEEISAVDVADDRATIRSQDGRELVVTPDDEGWLKAASRAQEALGREPVEAPAVTPEQLEAWLGVEPGGRLIGPFKPVLEDRRDFLSILICTLSGTVAIHAVDRLSRHAQALVLLVCGVAYTVLLAGSFAARRRRRGRLTADAEGLHIEQGGSRRTITWPTIRRFRKSGSVVALDTTDGDVEWTSFTGDEPLIATIEKVVEANQADPVLPRMSEDVPTGGLSRAADASVDLSRAVSRSDPPT